ncbi:MAG: T9SS type A sorting domain-containing protein [bacterium]|nr:T9SS type A sorting domain-containing protein [bacterium]
MRGTNDTSAIVRACRFNRAIWTVLLALLACCWTTPAAAWSEGQDLIGELGYNPGGAFITHGEYVMNVGNVHINITNWGLIGSAFSNPSTFSDAPSCQWPAGSGDEYLWSSGLWVGGVVLGERLVSTGGRGSEFLPLEEIEATIYESVEAKLLRPSGNADASGRRHPMPQPNDDDDEDEDGNPLIDEEILNGLDDDDDGMVDEDYAQVGNQMFVLTNYDNTALAREQFADHTPLNLEVVQATYQWENDQVDDFVGFEYKITNIGVTTIERVYIGFYSDSDIGSREGDSIADDDMAGSYRGLVRASDGSFVPVEVGYMYDGAESGRLDGYFGIVFLGHDVDPTGNSAPVNVGLRTFQSFQGQQAFEQGGDPQNDDERYQLLSAAPEEWDGPTLPGKQADFRFLVSAGPFRTLEPDEDLEFQVGMVVGSGRAGLLAHCAEAAQTWFGIWEDQISAVVTHGTNDENPDGEMNPGQYGRETILCIDDFDPDLYEAIKPDFGDTSCVTPDMLLGARPIDDGDRFTWDGKTCAMFNMDNCFECERQLGRECFPFDFDADNDAGWQCNRGDDATTLVGCTGIGGLDTQIHWIVGMAPPPPGLRLHASDSRVHIFWDDLSERSPDLRLQEIDFESYNVWRADNWDRPYGSSVANGPESTLWQKIAEYDVVNSFVNVREENGLTVRDTIPLGANTGLEDITYIPRVLDLAENPQYTGLADSMAVVVQRDPDGEWGDKELPYLFNSAGDLLQTFRPLEDWAYNTNEAVLDTFYSVAARAENLPAVEGKIPVRYYEYVDRGIHNGFLYFYSVTAKDHELLPATNIHNIDPDTPVGDGLLGDPSASFSNTTPGTEAQTAEERDRYGTNIYVFPNPATRDALDEYQQMFPTGDDPTGVRVTFTNLPEARNTVKIYTASGDLVETINHDGTTGIGHTSWNLMSRNGQEIVSGIYLYSVQSDDDRFEDFVGKFVVVR